MNAVDFVPKGRFCMEADQLRAIELVRNIGDKLASDHPEIADLYRQGGQFETYLGIAEEYVPQASVYPEVASKAVGYAMRRLVPRRELDAIRKIRSANRLEEQVGGFDSEEFRTHCRKAAKRRHELDIGVDTDAMVKARGRTPWKDDEKDRALEMSLDSAYQHQKGSPKGRPNYRLMAFDLNTEFHDGKKVRYENSVASFVKDRRRKK